MKKKIKRLSHNLNLDASIITNKMLSDFNAKYKNRIYDRSDGMYFIVTEVTRLDVDMVRYLNKYPTKNPLEDKDIGFRYDCVIITLSPGEYKKTTNTWDSDDLSNFKNEISFADLEKIILSHIKKDFTASFS